MQKITAPQYMREIGFHASWDETNSHLQPDPSSSQSCFYRRFHELCRWAILPASQISWQTATRVEQLWQERWEPTTAPGETSALLDGNASFLRTHYEAVILKMVTPDEVPLQGTLYLLRGHRVTDLPTILCVSPNAQLSRAGGWDWILKKGCRSRQPFHVITFDYRSCGLSGGSLRTLRNLELDAETVYQMATAWLRIPEENLHVLGYSLGGAVAAKLFANHPLSGRCVNLHSFDSLENVLKNSPEIDRRLASWRVPAVLRSALGPLRSYLGSILSKTGWGIDVREALERIRSRTLFVFHPEDPLIPETAGAANGAQLSGSEAAGQVARLQFKPSVVCECPGFNHHCAPLNLYQDADGVSASKRILNFLLGSELFVRSRPERRRSQVRIDPAGGIQVTRQL